MKKWSFLLTLVLAACSSEDPAGDPDAGVVDAGVDAEPVASCTCAVVGAEYGGGGVLSRVEVPSMEVTTDVVPLAASADPVVRVIDGRIYVINRFGFNNVTVVDRESWTLVTQLHTGDDSNPQDVAAVGDTVYVLLMDQPAVQVWDLANPAAPVRSCDLSALDLDGNPDAASIVESQGKLLVTLSLLDRTTWVGADPGKVAVIDPATCTVETTFDLVHANPFGFLWPRDGGWLTATMPDFSGTTGCLERVNADPPASGGCLIEHAALGGYVSGAAARGEETYVAVQWQTPEGAFRGDLVRIDAAGTASDPLSPPDQTVTDVVLCEATGDLVYADRTSGGVRLYDLDSAEISAPINIGLPVAFAGSIACW